MVQLLLLSCSDDLIDFLARQLLDTKLVVKEVTCGKKFLYPVSCRINNVRSQTITSPKKYEEHV